MASPHALQRLIAALAGLVAGALAVAMLPNATAASSHTAPTIASVSAAAPGDLSSRVRGTFGEDGTVRGTFTPARFQVRKGETYAFGVLRATLRNGAGQVIDTATKKITIPVRNARAVQGRMAQQATCDVLHLVLGPLDLNLLGLRVHLNRVVLDITSETGPGNLLGNLLCAVTGLLDGGPLAQLRLANVLNRILSVLRLT